ncbi:hypothetical protein Pan44_19730 [Caulifigura coniformis]|uniref:Uncharacterized protein n=1 Tax=Caulifigura coniformis TaxID=2527983 RepID=A0A517SCV9_9PLAN|nr:hypothetical protein Pan44_19730 [Caulifigura coniformis]
MLTQRWAPWLATAILVTTVISVCVVAWYASCPPVNCP